MTSFAPPSSPTAAPIPTAPGRLPLVGHAPALLRAPEAFLASLPRVGDLVRIRLGPARLLVLCEPVLARQVLRDDRTFDKGGPIYDRVREVGGDGLVTCPHARHRRQRRLAQPAFHRARLPAYCEAMARQVAAATSAWRDGQTLEVMNETVTIATRTAVETMFSGRLPAASVEQLVDDLNEVTTQTFRRVLTPQPLTLLPLPWNRRYDRARRRLRAFVDDMVAARRGDPGDRGDLLSALLDATAPGDGPAPQRLTDAEIGDQVITFFGAGSETTAVGLAWALYEVARHPRLQRRLRAEADEVLAGGAAAHAHLDRLELTARTVTETLRLHPPLWLLTRTVTRPTRLGPHRLVPGDTLAFSPYVLQRRGDRYPHPHRFDPDRWSGEATAAPGRDAFTAFGWGARKCIGDAFATAEIALALAMVVKDWELRPVAPGRVFAKPTITLYPANLRIRVREHRSAPAPGR
ncbi:cytochrome P450 [Spirillospora sp. NPDC050679]